LPRFYVCKNNFFYIYGLNHGYMVYLFVENQSESYGASPAKCNYSVNCYPTQVNAHCSTCPLIHPC